MGAPPRPPQFSAASEALVAKNKQSSQGMEAQLGRLEKMLKAIEEVRRKFGWRNVSGVYLPSTLQR